jgi:hypothetical protein
MTDDLADLLRLDRALDDLATGAGSGDLAGAGGQPAGTEPTGAQTDGVPTRELGGEPAMGPGGEPTVKLNGHRPPRAARRAGSAPGGQGPGERQERSAAVDTLVATAAELRAAVPAPSPEATARGRAAFLASSAVVNASQRRGRRRSLLLRAMALAAALLLVGIPGALARQALPGSPLFPVREAAQDARVALTSSPVSKARILLDDAERLRDEAVRSTAGQRDGCIRTGRAETEEALAKLGGVSGAAAERQWVRAQDLLDDFRDLAEGKLPGQDHSGPGGGDDRSGHRGSDDPGGDRHGGSGSGTSGSGGDDSGGQRSGSGGSGSGSTSDGGSGSGGSGSGSTSGSGSGSGDDGSGKGGGDG